MGKIKFGSEVYTWFMQGTGKGYDNKLDHMIKIAAEAGFTGIEPMVLEIRAPGCPNTGSATSRTRAMKDALAKHNMKLAGLALVCSWDGEPRPPRKRKPPTSRSMTLKHFPGAEARHRDAAKRPQGPAPPPAECGAKRQRGRRSARTTGDRLKSYHPNSPPPRRAHPGGLRRGAQQPGPEGHRLDAGRGPHHPRRHGRDRHAEQVGSTW